MGIYKNRQGFGVLFRSVIFSTLLYPYPLKLINLKVYGLN